uniref:Dipeptidylpeptidase IV N-terminal domain-containing protein n=1 Tax=Eiseniibacteriota bacterium TaxID=2212470 RepID=A0A832I3P8_UNCEI
MALALAAAAWLMPRGVTEGPQRRARLMIPEPPHARLSGLIQSIAISPDGRTVAFVAADSAGTVRLWVRPLEAVIARPLPGTENGDLPFWSPDGRALGFFADGKLKRIGVEGGRAEVLADAPDPRGGAWGAGGDIVFAPHATGGLVRVSDEGGAVSDVVRPDSAAGEVALRFPDFLPDGRHLTFVSLPRREGGFGIHVARLGDARRHLLMRADAAPVVAGADLFVTQVNERLIAQRFDARSGRLTGRPVNLGDAPLAVGHDGVRAASVSRTGVLVHSAGRRSNTQLAWLDRMGRIVEWLPLPTGVWEDVSIAPDDRHALVSRRVNSSDKELWLVDLASGQATRFSTTSSPQTSNAVWSPDGRRVAYTQSLRGPGDIFIQPLDGGAAEPLYTSPALFKNVFDWSPDGRHITFEQPVRGRAWDVFLLPVESERTPVAAVMGPWNEGGGWFSPDGRWLVYYSDEGGVYELYVRPFPGPGPRQPIPGTRTGATAFIRGCWWASDGRELAFMGSDGLVRSVGITPGATWSATRARDLFRVSDQIVALGGTSNLRRFLATIQVEDPPPAAIVVDLNWTEALRAR